MACSTGPARQGSVDAHAVVASIAAYEPPPRLFYSQSVAGKSLSRTERLEDAGQVPGRVQQRVVPMSDRLARHQQRRRGLLSFDDGVDGRHSLGPEVIHPAPNENAWLLGQAALPEESLLAQQHVGVVGVRVSG